MESKPIFECWCVFVTKLLIYQDRVEIRKAFGLSTINIPISKIASVGKGLTGVTIETTGGGKTDSVAPWNADKRQKAVDIILDLINNKKRG